MTTKLQENKTKGNNANNIALVNNIVQANSEINNDISLNNKVEIKSGFFNFVKAYIGKKTFRFIGEHNYNVKKYEYELNQRIQKIPEECIIQPRLSIVGPVMDNLRYNLDEEQIREMYTNILMNEIDERKQNEVLPAYIDIVKQLSKEDAQLINRLFSKRRKIFSLIEIVIRLKEKQSTSIILKRYIPLNLFNDNGVELCAPEQICLDNLERIKMIKITKDTYKYNDEKLNKKTFDYVILLYKDELLKDINFERFSENDFDFDYNQCLLEITDFGYNFMKICYSK